MASFSITCNYLIVDGVVHMTSAAVGASTSQTISKECKTSVAGNGEITLDAGDNATLTFQLGNDDDWQIESVQLADEGKEGFGAPPGGGNALDDDEEADFPDADQKTGTINATGTAPQSISFSDTNQKNKTVKYRVVFYNPATKQRAYSDPRVRNGGGSS